MMNHSLLESDLIHWTSEVVAANKLVSGFRGGACKQSQSKKIYALKELLKIEIN